VRASERPSGGFSGANYSLLHSSDPPPLMAAYWPDLFTDNRSCEGHQFASTMLPVPVGLWCSYATMPFKYLIYINILKKIDLIISFFIILAENYFENYIKWSGQKHEFST
jgi:hypothetical protein